jgi:hypothetical protein
MKIRLGWGRRVGSVVRTMVPLGLLCLGLVACGTADSFTAPSITVQPADQSAPLGASVKFAVVAAGTAQLSYRWSRNGVAIPAATNASYGTQPLTMADLGDSFSVTVSNGLGSVTSKSAHLTLGPRSPLAGDLRFQQVAAASTLPGYTEDENTNIPNPRQSNTFFNNIGTPLLLGPGDCNLPGGSPGCNWFFGTFFLPYGVTGLDVTYTTGLYPDFQSDLSQTLATNVVLTSLDLESQSGLYAWSLMRSRQASGFDGAFHSVLRSSLQSAANQEGANGRVITAISFDSGAIGYVSYGWTGNEGEVYETQVMSATQGTIAAVATQLASSGYIITALGGDQQNEFVLVGTRVAGDSLARPVLVISPGQPIVAISDGGYATVGYVSTPSFIPMWIGEK